MCTDQSWLPMQHPTLRPLGETVVVYNCHTSPQATAPTRSTTWSVPGSDGQNVCVPLVLVWQMGVGGWSWHSILCSSSLAGYMGGSYVPACYVCQANTTDASRIVAQMRACTPCPVLCVWGVGAVREGLWVSPESFCGKPNHSIWGFCLLHTLHVAC